MSATNDQHGNLIVASYKNVYHFTGYQANLWSLGKTSFHQSFVHNVYPFGEYNSMIVQIEDYENDFGQPISHFKLVNPTIHIYDYLRQKCISLEEFMGKDTIPNFGVLKNIYKRGDHLIFLSEDFEYYTFDGKFKLLGKLEFEGEFVDLGKNSDYFTYQNQCLTRKSFNGEILDEFCEINIEEEEYIIVDETGNLSLINLTKEKIKLKLLKENKFETYEFTMNKNNQYDEKSFHRNSRFFKYENYNDLEFFLVGKEIHTNTSKIDLLSGSNLDYIQSNDFYINPTGILYLATNSGVKAFNIKPKSFDKIHQNENGINSVRSIYLNDQLEIYNHDGQLEILNIQNSFESDIFQFEHPQIPTDILHEHTNEYNRVFLGGWMNKGVHLLDLKNEVHLYPNPGKVLNIPLLQFEKSETTGNIYACKNELYSFNGEKFQRIDEVNLDQQTDIQHLVAKDNKLWIACENGLKVFDEEKKSLITNGFLDTFQHKTSFIHFDKIDNTKIWLGTRDNGLFKVDLNNGVEAHYSYPSQLSNNSIHAILEDNNGRLWLPTNFNLNCLDKSTDIVSNFSVMDGVAHHEFNRYSYFEDKRDGRFYFGGLNGYTHFHPDSINTSDNPEIKLNIIKANYTDRNLNKHNVFEEISIHKKVVLEEHANTLQLDFNTNHIFNNENIDFYYRIAAETPKWTLLNNNQFILRRMDYGLHKFEFVSDLYKPNLRSNIVSIDFEFPKPFYKKNLFKLLIGLLALYLINLYNRIRVKAIKNQNEKLEEQVEIKTNELQEATKVKNKILAIIGHDIKNPLTSLLDINEKIKYLVKSNRYEEIEEITSQTNEKIVALDENLDNLLLWSLKELNEIDVEYQKIYPRVELANVCNIYHDQIKQKSLNVFNSIEDHLVISSDLVITQAIFRNIISNAIKFSFSGGFIHCCARKEAEKNIIQIIDNGVGFGNKDELASNSQLRTKNEGKQAGLLLIKELGKLVNIDIQHTQNSKGGISVNIIFNS